MQKYLGTAFIALLIGLIVPAPAATAAECGLLGTGCVPTTAPPPAPSPEPAPAPAPAPTPAPAPAPQPAAQPGLIEDTGAGARILSLVNQERSAAGMGALASRSQVTVIATGHSRAMAERGEIFHNSSYFTAASRKSLGARLLGENVAMNGSADDAHRRLMASPGHRANILNASFDAVGLAVVRDGSGALFVTQNFMASATAPARAAAPAPAARAATPSRPAAVRPPAPVSTASVPTAPAVAAPSPPPTTAPTTPGPSTPAEAPEPVENQAPRALGALSGLLAGAVALAGLFVRYGWLV